MREAHSARPLATVAASGAEDAQRAIAGMAAPVPARERAPVLRSLAEALEGDAGATLGELEARGAGVPVALWREHLLPALVARLRSCAASAAQSPEERQAVGRVALILPILSPLACGLWELAPALAAGNVALVKPPAACPLSLLALADVLAEAGLEPGALSVLCGEGAVVGEELASHPEIDLVSLTGSTATGRRIMQLAASTVKDLRLRLGGDLPVLVLDGADPEAAAEGVLGASLLARGPHAGRGTRVIATAEVHDELLAALRRRLAALHGGDPADPATELAHPQARDADPVPALLRVAEGEGARIELAGPGPVLLSGVTPEMTIALQEVPGPVISVLGVDTPVGAVAAAGETVYARGAVVWAASAREATGAARLLRVPRVWCNDPAPAGGEGGWGGWGQSGIDGAGYARERRISGPGGRPAPP